MQRDNKILLRPAWSSADNQSRLYQSDCLVIMDLLIDENPAGCFDMIFADPPYKLSNGGISCQSGKMVSVDKGAWDRSNGVEEDHLFTMTWLAKCQKLLKPNGTIWVSGTMHLIYSVGFALQKLNFKILNDIIWEKPNPPPNLACRYFTHSTETILWAAKEKKSKHYFNYNEMKSTNGGKQMKSVWRMTSPKKHEKGQGKHPAQKPLELVSRCIQACTVVDDIIFDPFSGSGTTGVAALSMNRKFVGIENNAEYVDLSIRRLSNITKTGE